MKPCPRHKLAAIIALVLMLTASRLAWAQAPAAPDPTAPILPRLPGALSGQDASIKITTTIDKAVIRVGDLIQYSMIIEAPEGSQIMMTQPGLQLGSFIIRDYSFPGIEGEKHASASERIKAWFDRELGGGPGPKITRQEFNFTITAYMTGDLVIPPMPFGVADPEGKRHAFFSESARVRVVPFTSPDDLTIKDVKAPLEVPIPASMYLPYVLVPLAFVTLAVVALVLILRRRRVEEERAAPRPPHEVALEELLALEREDLLGAGEYERFYTRLSLIFRKYMATRFMFYALEYTTPEIVEALKSKDLDHGDHEKARRLLIEADLVKFARHQPAASDRNCAIDLVRELVYHTRERLPEDEQLVAA